MKNLVLLLSLLVCHYIGDYCLTFPALIRAKAGGRDLLPILQHAGIHGLLLGVCLLLFGMPLPWTMLMAGVEIASHFCIDTAKARISVRFPLLADPNQKPYWMLYGFDQLLHLSIIVAIVYGCGMI